MDSWVVLPSLISDSVDTDEFGTALSGKVITVGCKLECLVSELL